jgi:hypothetical protein
MKHKSAMPKMSAGYIIQCAAIGPRFFNGGGVIADDAPL